MILVFKEFRRAAHAEITVQFGGDMGAFNRLVGVARY